MPSYVIHHIAGNKLLDKYKICDKERGLFLLGNLIPDSSKIFGNETNSQKIRALKDEYKEDIQKEKISTHFRRSEDISKNVQLPYLKYFMDKYGDIIDDPTVLGYYYHLFVDREFFGPIFNETFTCLDSNNVPTDNSCDTKKYQILKSSEILAPKLFWSNSGIYGDYTKMNKLLLEYYGVVFDENELRKIFPFFINPGIDEVNYTNIEAA